LNRDLRAATLLEITDTRRVTFCGSDASNEGTGEEESEDEDEDDDDQPRKKALLSSGIATVAIWGNASSHQSEQELSAFTSSASSSSASSNGGEMDKMHREREDGGGGRSHHRIITGMRIPRDKRRDEEEEKTAKNESDQHDDVHSMAVELSSADDGDDGEDSIFGTTLGGEVPEVPEATTEISLSQFLALKDAARVATWLQRPRHAASEADDEDADEDSDIATSLMVEVDDVSFGEEVEYASSTVGEEDEDDDEMGPPIALSRGGSLIGSSLGDAQDLYSASFGGEGGEGGGGGREAGTSPRDHSPSLLSLRGTTDHQRERFGSIGSSVDDGTGSFYSTSRRQHHSRRREGAQLEFLTSLTHTMSAPTASSFRHSNWDRDDGGYDGASERGGRADLCDTDIEYEGAEEMSQAGGERVGSSGSGGGGCGEVGIGGGVAINPWSHINLHTSDHTRGGSVSSAGQGSNSGNNQKRRKHHRGRKKTSKSPAPE